MSGLSQESIASLNKLISIYVKAVSFCFHINSALVVSIPYNVCIPDSFVDSASYRSSADFDRVAIMGHYEQLLNDEGDLTSLDQVS